MASLFNALNRLLPFATPGTPLVQDLVHLGAICTLLYYAPQIQQWIQVRQQQQHQPDGTAGTPQQAQAQDQQANAPGNEEVRDDHEVLDGAEDELPILEPQDHDDGPVAQGEANVHIQEGQPGPVNPAATANQRNVGAKKAKSLARRDQRRAYHEFQRSQGEAQRAREAEGAAEREAALAAEKERRKAVEAAVEAKRAKERERKREAERKQRDDEIRRRDLAVRLVKEELKERRMCDLFGVAKQVGGDADEEWVERILTASGLLGMKDGTQTMVTSVGWAVRVSQEDVQRAYEEALEASASENEGAISYEQFAGLLEGALKEPVTAGG